MLNTCVDVYCIYIYTKYDKFCTKIDPNTGKLETQPCKDVDTVSFFAKNISTTSTIAPTDIFFQFFRPRLFRPDWHSAAGHIDTLHWPQKWLFTFKLKRGRKKPRNMMGRSLTWFRVYMLNTKQGRGRGGTYKKNLLCQKIRSFFLSYLFFLKFGISPSPLGYSATKDDFRKIFFKSNFFCTED